MKKQLIRPLRDGLGTTECSALESGMRHAYPGMLLCYPERLDAERMARALASVLDDFAPYAGQFAARGLELQIRNGTGGVSFESEQLGSSLESLSNDARAGRVKQLEPRQSKLAVARAQSALLAVKLTEARDGCALAVVWNHVVGDMHSTMLLMRAWAAAYAGRSYDKPLLVPDRDDYLRRVMPDPSEARSSLRLASWPTTIAHGVSLVRPANQVSVEYTWPELEAIHAALGSSQPVTQNDALCAHVYASLRTLSGATEPTNLCMVVNYRKRVGLSQQLVGNMTSLLAQPVDETDGPARIAAGLRARLQDYATKHANYHATMRVIDAHPRRAERSRLVNRLFEPGRGDILITNWNDFGTYQLQFGASTPTLFLPMVLGATGLPQWFMIIYELPDARGLRITLGLPQSLAERWRGAEGQALLHRVPRLREAAPGRPAA